jgi:lysophospholipase L1-like esterase
LVSVATVLPDRAGPVVPLLAFVGLAVGGGLRLASDARPEGGFLRRVPTAGWTTAGLVLLWVTGQPAVRAKLGEREGEVARRLTTAELNAQDATQLQRGYYEQLMGASRLNSQLWEIYMKRPPEAVGIGQTQAGRRRDDFMWVELVASQRIVNGGAIISTNRWAMRDRDYEMAKPAGTFRIALTGASTTMGWSVQDDETFERLVEDRMNSRPFALLGGRRVEILNFAVPGYTPPQFAGQIDRMLEFEPDLVLITTQDNDVRRTVTRLVDYELAGTPVPFDSVQRLVSTVTAGAASKVEAERRLRPHARDVLGQLYQIMADRSRAAGVAPVWMYLPGLDRVPDPADREILVSAARDAGFTIVDLSGVYEGRPRKEVTVAEYDFHPNALGHRLVAQRLLDELARRPELFVAGSRP